MIWILLIAAAILIALFKGKKPDQAGSIPRAGNALSHLNLPLRIRKWAGYIEAASQEFGVAPEIIAAVIEHESAGDPQARGSAGEVGLGQLKQIAIDDLIAMGYNVKSVQTTDPWENTRQTAAFLDLQLSRMGNLYEGLAAYNQGQKGALQDLSEPGIQAAEDYAEKVLNIINRFTHGQ